MFTTTLGFRIVFIISLIATFYTILRLKNLREIAESDEFLETYREKYWDKYNFIRNFPYYFGFMTVLSLGILVW